MARFSNAIPKGLKHGTVHKSELEVFVGDVGHVIHVVKDDTEAFFALLEFLCALLDPDFQRRRLLAQRFFQCVLLRKIIERFDAADNFTVSVTKKLHILDQLSRFPRFSNDGASATNDRLRGVGVKKPTPFLAGNPSQKRTMLSDGFFGAITSDPLCSRIPVDDMHLRVDDKQAAGYSRQGLLKGDVFYDGTGF